MLFPGPDLSAKCGKRVCATVTVLNDMQSDFEEGQDPPPPHWAPPSVFSSYTYRVTVETGPIRNATESAFFTVRLKGVCGMSPRLTMFPVAPAHTETFVLYSPQHLGDLSSLELGHTSSSWLGELCQRFLDFPYFRNRCVRASDPGGSGVGGGCVVRRC